MTMEFQSFRLTTVLYPAFLFVPLIRFPCWKERKKNPSRMMKSGFLNIWESFHTMESTHSAYILYFWKKFFI